MPDRRLESAAEQAKGAQSCEECGGRFRYRIPVHSQVVKTHAYASGRPVIILKIEPESNGTQVLKF